MRIFVVCLFCVLNLCTIEWAPAQDPIDFTTQVKPLLSDNCYACHGPDESQRSTELRLDDQASSLADLGGYAAVVPNDTDASELVKRILADDDTVMPPAEHRKKLDDTQKQILVQWIKEGANWSQHWAFVKPVAAEDPKTLDVEWPENFIDRFVLERLEKESLNPSPTADDHALLRRLAFDLTGLPPQPSDVRDFAGTAASYSAAVDRLLASEHFGERMAVYWLDLVRYADTVGYHGDQPVSVTPYRDYVIDSFNGNRSFKDFTIEQLAGDLFDNPTQSQLIASGYNRLGMMSAEGGVQPEEYLAKYAADRVRTTASVWLGVTLGCAECHDHKFDPFTTKEFYEFAAFFADIKERGLYAGANRDGKWGPKIDVPDEGLADLLKPIDAEIAELNLKLRETEEVKKERGAWEKTILESSFEWKNLTPASVVVEAGIVTKVDEDGSILISGKNPDEATYVVTVNLPKSNQGTIASAIRLEALPHESLPASGPGRAGNGNFVLSELLMVRGNHQADFKRLKKEWKNWPAELKEKSVDLVNASATSEQTYGGESHPNKKWSAASAFDLNKNGRKWGWAVLPNVGKQNELVFQIAKPETSGDVVTIVLQQNHGNGGHSLGRFRLSYTKQSNATADPKRLLPDNVREVLPVEVAKRTAQQEKAIADYFVSIAPRFAATRKQIEELKILTKTTVEENTRTTLVTTSVPPREMRVLGRGDWMDKSGDVVSPGVPESLGERTWEDRATRKDLAEWIVDDNNPLTARVFVNRVWRMFFGVGLSNVLDDLGSQGEPPSHAALLDRLAIEFVKSGWDVKHLVRLIVTSKTYRQSSSYRDELKTLDPENRLLARQSRFRLDAEFIRDNALAVSGLLVRDIGGRNGKPYQPPGLYRHLNFPARKYQASTDDGQYRRGVYTHWQRQFLHPAMKTFDAPSREECTAARPRSSTPLAALVMLNDPSYVEAARVLADRVLEKSDDFEARMQFLFESAFSRKPTDDECLVLQKLYIEHLDYYSSEPEKAKSMLTVGLAKSKSKLPLEERAAWASVCRAVLNMHEFVLRK